MYFFVFAAAAMALYFAVAALQRPRPAEFLAVVLWAAYAVYETFVANGTLCSSDCNIRVDLVLFFPLLGWATWLALRKESRTGAVVVLAVVCLGLVSALASLFGYTAMSAIAGVCALIVGALGLKSALATKRASG